MPTVSMPLGTAEASAVGLDSDTEESQRSQGRKEALAAVLNVFATKTAPLVTLGQKIKLTVGIFRFLLAAPYRVS